MADRDSTPAVTLAARAWQAWTQGQVASAQALARAAEVAVRRRPLIRSASRSKSSRWLSSAIWTAPAGSPQSTSPSSLAMS
jgi:hypothetical protein